jgi:hypothetical protein
LWSGHPEAFQIAVHQSVEKIPEPSAENDDARPVATQGPLSDNGLQDRRSTNTISDGSATVQTPLQAREHSAGYRIIDPTATD